MLTLLSKATIYIAINLPGIICVYGKKSGIRFWLSHLLIELSNLELLEHKIKYSPYNRKVKWHI